jgi:hypothetical protein
MLEARLLVYRILYNILDCMEFYFYSVPCVWFQCCPECKWYFRDVLFYACGGAALLGAFALLLLSPFKVGQRRGGPPPAAYQNGEARSAAALANGATERTPLLR